MMGAAIKKIIPGIAVLAVLALSGCSPYRAGRVDAGMGLPAINGPVAEGQLYGGSDRWWEGFEDPVLSRLIERALRDNLDVRQAYERLLQARAAAREAGAPRMPSLTAMAAGGRLRQQSMAGPVESDTYSASLNLTFELDVWGKLGSRAMAAVLDGQAAGEALKATYMDVSAEVAELYFSAIEQKAQLALSRLTIESLARIKDSVELRYRAGIVTALDLYQARQNLAVASTGGPLYESGYASALSALAVAMGNAPGQLAVSIPGTLPVPPEFPREMPSDLLMRRPEVSAALRSMQASDYRVAAAVADRFPSFSLTASYGGASDELSEVMKSPNIIWNALMNITMPIIDGGRRRAAAERARAVLNEKLAAYHKAVLMAMGDTQVALSRNANTEKQILLLEQSVRAGENTLRVAQSQYMQGVTDYLNVLSAQQQLHSAQSGLLLARRQLLSGRIQLARSLGGGWMAQEVAREAARRDGGGNKQYPNDKAGPDGEE